MIQTLQPDNETDNLSDEEARRLLDGAEELMSSGEGVEDVDQMFENGSPLAYVGFEPSGRPHLGHLLTLQKLNDLADIGFDTRILLADRHAFKNNKPRDVPLEERRERIAEYAETYREAFEALGTEAEFVNAYDLHDSSSFRDIKDQLGNQISNDEAVAATGDVSEGELTQGQTEYPVLQVADMYHMGINLAVGGMDQRKIHSLARDYQPLEHSEEDKPAALHMPLIGVNLGEGEKMSSSKGTAVYLNADPDDISSTINGMYLPGRISNVKDDFGEEVVESAQANSLTENEIIYQASPVLQLVHHFPMRREGVLEWQQPEEYGGEHFEYNSTGELIEDMREGEAHPADIKSALSEYISEMTSPVRERLN